jgi:putative oxygen-independent coproporphyrinogen III oxidase
MPEPAPLALYIHWPFCVSKCPYCDFNSHVRDEIDNDLWRKGLLADLAHEASLLPNRQLGSIFFGGGTPSLMPPALVSDLIHAATSHWQAMPDIEITLEANPNSVETARFADLATAGVNRVSLGLQSLRDESLRFLGRAHDSQEGLKALEKAQRHFPRVSFDLIYALPDHNEVEWRNELLQALSYGTDHLSLYQLTIEPGTRFETMVRKAEFTPLDSDRAANLFEMTQDMTAEAGTPAYEISNHARPGQESRHNLTYWRYGDYAGVGPGAHGRRGGFATVRHRKPENWLSAVERNQHGLEREERLTPADRAREALLMGLRLREGVDIRQIAARTGISERALIEPKALTRMVDLGLLTHNQSRISITSAGMLLLDAILAEVVAV